MAEELIRGDSVQVDENTSTEEDYENWENWMPDPIDAEPRNFTIAEVNYITTNVTYRKIVEYSSKQRHNLDAC